MDFNLTEQQGDVIQSMREYGSKVFTIENIRQWREDQGLPDDVVQDFARRYFPCLRLRVVRARSRRAC